MTRRQLEIHLDAGVELEAAVAWYADRSRQAAQLLVFEVDRAIEDIIKNPERWPEHVFGTRRYLLKRFPFLVVYRVTDQAVQIVAFAHGRRRPGYWRSRVSAPSP